MSNGTIGMLPQERLPAPSSVLTELTLRPKAGATIGAAAPPAAAAGPIYRVLRTLEVDEYDAPIQPAEIMGLVAPRVAPSDNAFRGNSRKVAKLSIAEADTEVFDDLKDLIETLEDHDVMKNNPDLSTDRNNNRVAEERRNVRVTTFLYAASMEEDNDFHLIVGRDPSKSEKYMTVEISGLPPQSSPHFNDLNSARDSYFEFFGDGLPGTSYDFYDPPIPVVIEGSLFFDMSHASGSRPGPSTLRPRMPVVWEIHPIRKIEFEP
jgi:hypothetical protein